MAGSGVGFGDYFEHEKRHSERVPDSKMGEWGEEPGGRELRLRGWGWGRSRAVGRALLVHGEAELNFALFGGIAGLAAGAFHGCFVGAQAAHFVEDPLGFEFGLQTFEGAINGLAFLDLNFGHG